MKIYKWTNGLSVGDNIRVNLELDRLSKLENTRKVKDVLNDEVQFDFAPYIKNRYNNKFPQGMGQQLGCAIHWVITGD